MLIFVEELDLEIFTIVHGTDSTMACGSSTIVRGTNSTIARESSTIVRGTDSTMTRENSASPEDFLPKVACRISVKKNGTMIQSAKQLQIDLNVDYTRFMCTLWDNVYKKAQAEYDLFDINCKIKYAWISKKRILNGFKQKPVLANECADLQDRSDYEALQQEIRASSNKKRMGETINDMLLYINASVTVTINSAVIESRESENAAGENDAELHEIRGVVIVS